ncbi:MAG: RagB/SusD family nutrient uptake outer membrane protein [Dysgonamonadaceae bacterium]|jgi:hypothetical protein|nr:RagB/SusD family nutrient uptake outer membrane protein [Dysgonamonadaceae bacterium]
MKKRFFYSIISLVLLASACNDNFDPKIYGKLSSTNFPQTESDYESVLMTCYIPFQITWSYWLTGNSQYPLNSPPGGCIRMFDVTSDAAAPFRVNSWGSGWLQLSEANYSDCPLYGRGQDDARPSNFEKIKDITRMTQIIGLLEDATVLSEDTKNHFLGEARLLRGLMMYYLLHIYGPVPVIMDAHLVGNFEAESNLVRPSLEQMSQWIYDDFDFARQKMSNTAIKGRFTADYAKFYLMKHCLNEGEYMTGYYDKAIEMYEALKASDRNYSLFTQGGNTAYANQFKQGYKFNIEVIMAVPCTEAGDGEYKNGNFNPLSFYVIPADAAKYADVANTIPTPFEKQGGGWGHLFNVAPLFYDTYEQGDVRRNVILTSYVQNNSRRIVVTRNDLGVKWSGFILNKFPVEVANQYQPTDIPLARWADVLLMYAEAVARKNRTVPNGEALKGVNDVRARAGLPALDSSVTGNYDKFMDALLAERGHEFLYEGFRKIDLIRFNKYRRNCRLYKGVTPSHQYMPIPNYAVEQAESYGKTLMQTFERQDWNLDN